MNVQTELALDIKQWLIDNTRTPRTPFSRNHFLAQFSIQKTDSFHEILIDTDYKHHRLEEGNFVLLRYNESLSELVGLAVKDSEKETVNIGSRGRFTAFNIDKLKDVLLYTIQMATALKIAEAGYPVVNTVAKDYEVLSTLPDKIMLLDGDLILGQRKIPDLSEKDMRCLIIEAINAERNRNIENQLKDDAAYKICKRFVDIVRDVLELRESDNEIMDRFEIKHDIVNRFICETIRDSRYKDKFWILNSAERLHNHVKKEAWTHLVATYGHPFNKKSLEQAKRDYFTEKGICEHNNDTKERFKSITAALTNSMIEMIYWHIEHHNQQHELSYRVDMFAQDRVVRLLETKAIFTLTHKPIKAESNAAIESFDQSIIDDYKEHFPKLDDVLTFIVMSRFAPDRKKSYLWIHAPSDWGKGFFKSVLNNLNLIVDLSVKEVESMFEGKPAGRSPDDFRRAFALVFDEFKAIKSELKQIENRIKLAPKFELMSEVEVFAKLFFSAENVPSLLGTSGVEDQMANRFNYIHAGGILHGRQLLKKIGSGEYMRHITGYVQHYVNTLVADMQNLGRYRAEQEAEVHLNQFHVEHGISNYAPRLSLALHEIADEFVEWLRRDADYYYKNCHMPSYDKHDYLFHKEDDLFLKRPGNILSDWLRDNHDASEFMTINRRRDEILKLVSENGTGKLERVRDTDKNQHRALRIKKSIDIKTV